MLLSVAFMMLGNGLQNILLGVRATLEGFSDPLIGLVMSAYFAGFFVGSNRIPRFVGTVGHVRVFAALAALASIAILVQAIFVTWPVWTAARAVTGFCFAGLYIVCESWLNDRAENETRGQLLSIYMVIQFSAVTGSQLMLNLASPAGYELFILVSILLSAAVLPVALAPSPTPRFDAPSRIGIFELYKVSPLGVVGMLGVGLSVSVFAGMGAVYAKKTGMSDVNVSLFMTIAMLGAAISQWPVGRLSDRLPRRTVITAITLAAAAVALAGMLVAGSSRAALFLLGFVFSTLSMPMYSLCIAHTNDYLRPAQMVAASSSLVLTYGIGAIFGPLSVGWVMSSAGPAGFFAFLAAVHGAIGLFAIYRMFRRPAPPPDERRRSVPSPGTVTVAATPSPPSGNLGA
ncbi:MAG: MFS transporter [Dongiaceae bacterium]